eukprot:13073155-Ditylum_brightwellii.AAC.2
MHRAQGGRLNGHARVGGAHDDAGLVLFARDHVGQRAQHREGAAGGVQPLGREADGALLVD